MKDIGKILAFLAAVVLLGCLLAPPLYWAGNAIGREGFLPFLDDVPLQRYFNRAVLVAALVLLWPLIRWLDVRGVRDLTMQPDPLRWKNLFIGIAFSVALMTVLGAILVTADVYSLRREPKWGALAKVPFTAAAVSIIEEIVFRGFLLGLVARAASRWGALIFTSALYSIVHFVKSRDDVMADQTIQWFSAFLLLPHSFWQFRDPLVLAGGVTTLFALGLVLGYAALKTGSLWLPIGLHAGMILGKFSFTKITKRQSDETIWVGKHLEVGLVALLMMAALGSLVYWWLNHGPGRASLRRR